MMAPQGQELVLWRQLSGSTGALAVDPSASAPMDEDIVAPQHYNQCPNGGMKLSSSALAPKAVARKDRLGAPTPNIITPTPNVVAPTATRGEGWHPSARSPLLPISSHFQGILGGLWKTSDTPISRTFKTLYFLGDFREFSAQDLTV
ncbi:hypothetical protein Fmac_002429 [Flemingia macrophylla]|uniref:Uncharacterized protein n=1 Tax=Flemingia macrophylla TaxID=520843 RepID=A0ABD1NJX1_9FABA